MELLIPFIGTLIAATTTREMRVDAKEAIRKDTKFCLEEARGYTSFTEELILVLSLEG